MKELGGCRVWDWKPQQIEAMLVKLGLEERTIDERTGTRRRRKNAVRRQASPQNGVHQHAGVMGDWTNGLGLHSHAPFHGHAHAHHVATTAATMSRPYDTMMADEGGNTAAAASTAPPAYTSDQENEYLDQIFGRADARCSSLSSDESMEVMYEHEDAPSNHQQCSERAALMQPPPQPQPQQSQQQQQQLEHRQQQHQQPQQVQTQ